MSHFDVIIAGAGLSGLAVSHFLEKSRPELKQLLFEKTDRPGGAVRTSFSDGFLSEWGPHGFLDNIEESRDLLDDLKMDDQMQKAPLKKFLRYICRKGALQVIPQTPPAVISSGLLPLTSKMRVLGDLVRKPRMEEQSISDWAAYRFGKAILPFADIAQTGTYAGDFEKLSIDSAMPGLRELELKYGSVFKGAIKSRREKAGRRMPSMVSFRKGMEQLVIRLAEGRQIVFNSALSKISRQVDTWRIETESGVYTADKLVLALHINNALRLLDPLDSAPEQAVSEAVVYNVVMGFGADAEIPYGFGYLAPKIENRFALGSLFPTHMFPGRSPDGMASLEVLIGGIRNPQHLDLSDDELIASTFADVSQLINLPSKPHFTKVLRPEIGIPQLDIGHHRLQSYREKMEINFPGLHINGFGWEGIGINDIIKQAKQTAENLLKGVGGERGPVTVKGVYF